MGANAERVRGAVDPALLVARSVPLDELEAIVRKHHGEFKLTKLAEAIEYRKTLGADRAGPSFVAKRIDRPPGSD